MLNRIVLIGRLTRDPELRFTPNGHAVCSFTLAVDGRLQIRSYDGNDGQRRYVTEVIADNVRFLSSRNEGNASSNSNNTGYESPNLGAINSFENTAPLTSDDLPF